MPYECEKCGEMFGTIHTLRIHFQRKHARYLFGCDECEKTFSRKAHMKEHKRTHRKHHNDDYGPIPCPECLVTFTTVMKLRNNLIRIN